MLDPDQHFEAGKFNAYPDPKHYRIKKGEYGFRIKIYRRPLRKSDRLGIPVYITI